MPNLIGTTSDRETAGVFGESTYEDEFLAGPGVHGKSNSYGVIGESSTSSGVYGISESESLAGVMGYNRNNTDKAGPGVYGTSVTMGVYGKSQGVGVLGESLPGVGVWGESDTNTGVIGKSHSGIGVIAESTSNMGLFARTHSEVPVPALMAHQGGPGDIIVGRNNSNVGVFRVLNNGDVEARGITLTSDKNAKENFSSVNTLQILDKLASMPIQSWNFKDDSSSERHIGPAAQDFHATFGLNGDNNIQISSIDVQGVALAAIQGLNEKLLAENTELHAKLANLEDRLSALESKG